ncbi:hypothetical protein ACFY8B_24985 [Streptomyces sp. NPDC012751]|uniref:hypothetical protein n=1 Tax=Streptomyces sp. NPDC012751 TaxID=3364846 RepID=UPI0036B8D233
MHLRHSPARTAPTASATVVLTSAAPTTAAGSPVAGRTGFTAALPATWRTDRVVRSVTAARGVVYVGASSGRVRPPDAKPGDREAAREDFAAFAPVTGELPPYGPSFGGGKGAVRAREAAPDGTALHADGWFGTADGRGVADAVPCGTAGRTPRAGSRPAVPATGGRGEGAGPRTRTVAGGILRAGGAFTAADGVPRRSASWGRSPMTYTDAVAAGPRHQNTITVTDGKGTPTGSAPLTVATPADARGPGQS